MWTALTQTRRTGNDDQEGDVLALAFSPDGRWLACGTRAELWFWDLHARPPGRPTILPVKPFVATNALAFHPTESSWLASGGSDGEVLIWDLSDLQAKDNPWHLSGRNAAITRLLFTPDGQRLIASSEDGTAHRWSFDRLNAEVRPTELVRLPAGITCMTVSADAKVPLVAIGGADGDVRLCRANAEDVEPTPLTLSWDRNSVVDLAFSEDGRRLAIATDDRSVHVVDVHAADVHESKRSTESSIRLEDHEQLTTSMVLASDGRRIFAAGSQGSLRVWPLCWTPKLDELVTQLAERNLSSDEWDESFPNQAYRKTFDNLPIHLSLIESARHLARIGQMAEATQRLEGLLANDSLLRLDPQTEVKLSAAEGLIENGRRRAMRGEKPKAISQFEAAKLLVPWILRDPREETDKYEVMGKVADVNDIISEIKTQVNAHNRANQFEFPADNASNTNDQLEKAQSLYKQVKELDRADKLGLLGEIMLIGNRIKAIELDLEARQLASEGKDLRGREEVR